MLQIALVFVLILFNAFFSLAEYALITVRSSRIRQLAEEGNRNALLVERMKERPTRMQATLQTGLTLVTTFSSAVAATSLVDPVAHWLQNHSGGFFAGPVVVTVMHPELVGSPLLRRHCTYYCHSSSCSSLTRNRRDCSKEHRDAAS